MRQRKRLGWMAVVAGVLAIGGCGDGAGDVLGPFQPQISTVTDNFQFQVTD